MKHLRRFLFALGCTAFLLFAEDFWVKKPFTEWSIKDATKLLQNSPWAHEISVGGAMPIEGGSAGGGRRGGGGNNDMGGMATGGTDAVPGGAGGRRGGGGGGYPSETGAGPGGGPSMMLRVRWQSALPIRQAIVLTQLGPAKADSDQAKKFLSQVSNEYVVAVVGLPATLRIPEELLNELAKGAALQRKDKDPIPAGSVQRIPGEKGS